MRSHPLEEQLNADAADILSAIQNGFRAIIDVKGKLAEYFLERELARLRQHGIISDYHWSDKDGEPDFWIDHKGSRLKMECKNIRSKELFRLPPSYKVELQKTRNSKDGTNTRGYKRNEFDILAACIFNHTKRWEYLFICTSKLAIRPTDGAFLKIMQPVPFSAASPWHSTLEAVINEGTRIRNRKEGL
jgi:hypothetical protein